jgi:putative hydrolase of the HAD superfamily
MPDAVGAVILDMDGVIRRWRPGPAEAVGKAHGLPSGTIASVALAVPEYQLGVLGDCTFADWLDAIARELLTHIGVDAREAVHRWASYRGDIDRHTMAIVEQLRTRAPVHVLSNAHDCFMDDMRQLGLSEAFDSFHYSAEMRLAKPDPAAYLKVLDRIGMPANRCVFVDDHTENVVAARSVGILGFDYTTPAALADAMSPLLIETEHT